MELVKLLLCSRRIAYSAAAVPVRPPICNLSADLPHILTKIVATYNLNQLLAVF
jgi:hypothetical protein